MAVLSVNPLWIAEFPDFPADTMPAIPQTWRDISWANEPCPCFAPSDSLAVYVDFSDVAKREFAEGPRFIVVAMEDGAHPVDGSVSLFWGDDWQAVLAFVESECAVRS